MDDGDRHRLRLVEQDCSGRGEHWSFFSLDPRTVAENFADGSADVQMIAARLTFKFGRDEPEPLK
jgi:hypothetical protein